MAHEMRGPAKIPMIVAKPYPFGLAAGASMRPSSRSPVGLPSAVNILSDGMGMSYMCMVRILFHAEMPQAISSTMGRSSPAGSA